MAATRASRPAATRVHCVSCTCSTMPRAPSAAPIAAPPTVDATTYAVTVLRQDAPRPRSPSGVMLASIDSPQGDQVARMPAAAATARPTTRSKTSRAKVVVRSSGEAGMSGRDADVQQLGIDPGRVVVPFDVRRSAGSPRGPVVGGLCQQPTDGRPVRPGALARDAAARPVDVDEVRRAGHAVALPGRVRRDDLQPRDGEGTQPRLALLVLHEHDEPCAVGQLCAGAKGIPEWLARAAPGRQESEQGVLL